jgi:predicted phage replisome organizer
MASDNKKYYWLKLKRDFFKRHDIRIIEEMPNGKDYILFYLKLLLESVDHEGELRFSDTIPYNEQMLSVVTNTNIDIVRAAMKLFVELNMMSVYDDQTIYMNEVDKLIGGETKWAEKKRLQRAKEDNVPQLSSKCPTEIELEKELKKDKEIEDIASASDESEAPKRKRFVPPTIDEVKAYCRERQNDVDAERFIDYYTSNGWRVGKNKMRDWEAAVRTWERNTGRTIAVKQNASSDLDDIF